MELGVRAVIRRSGVTKLTLYDGQSSRGQCCHLPLLGFERQGGMSGDLYHDRVTVSTVTAKSAANSSPTAGRRRCKRRLLADGDAVRS